MPRKTAVAVFVIVAILALPLLGAVKPEEAIQQARERIARKDFQGAAALLDAALPQTDTLPENVQAQARTAIHFYAAVAYSGLRRDAEALEHLREALKLSPNIRAVDPSKYDAHFVALFDQARASDNKPGKFSDLYPVFSPAPSDSPWDDAIVVELLASRSEKRDWKAATTPDQRAAFLAAFWRVRDRNPATKENEYRDTIHQRIAIADAAFKGSGERGALTDRGRVYILLGEPAHVERRSMKASDGVEAMSIGSIGIDVGTMEFWYYTSEQLPIPVSQPTTIYRFATHQGIGEQILQRDGVAMNTLNAAARFTAEQ